MSNFQFNKTQRLSKDGYKRPTYTTTDKLSITEIRDLLKGYTGVDDIRNVELGIHLRYFIIGDDGKKRFRYGGVLTKNIMPKQNKYVILSNGTKSWPVQLENRVFFRKMTRNELIEESEGIIKKLKKENRELKEKIKMLRKRLKHN